jgi:hypothetical protein
MASKTILEEVQEFAQAALALAPVIILGSGASAAHGVPGMWPLSEHLKVLPRPPTWSTDEGTEWDRFIGHLTDGKDLETAMGAVRFTDGQTTHVAEATRALLLPTDEVVLAKLLTDRHSLPLTRLFKHLFKSTHRTIDVITPNYDRIAEYAADAGEFCHFTGFSYGYLQTRAKDTRTRLHYGKDLARTVCVWKVHGSLDWFRDKDNQIIGVRSCHDSPPGFSPLMITPGVDKYRLALTEPFRTIFGCSDDALEKARSYFCVGYGFNDEHLQTKLVERCDINAVPIVIVTKELTAPAKAFLGGGRCRKYLALEEATSGARAYTNAYPAGVDLPTGAIWRLNEFLDLTLGAAP